MAAVALLAASSCGGRTIEPEATICAHARILPIDPVMVTPTGRVLQSRGDGWTIGQLEADGTLTPVTTLVTNEPTFSASGWLEHDPVSGRMWLLEGVYSQDEPPPSLYQFDADGQVEWMVELVDYARPVQANSLHYHESSLYVALSMEGVWPEDPSEPITYNSLVIERRDLDGEVVWVRNDYAPPNTSELFNSALLVDVSGSALSMIVTPPLTDYGPSYPLTIDIETGDVLWSSPDGHDPLRMAVGDGRLALAWVTPRQHDPERLPEQVVVAPTSSSLSVHDPSSGAQAKLSTVEWSAIDWDYPGWGGQSVIMGWMGSQLISVIESDGVHGVTVHDKHGNLVCQGALDLEFDAVGRGVGIEGRSQLVAGVSVAVDDSGDPVDPVYERGLLLIEPVTDR